MDLSEYNPGTMLRCEIDGAVAPDGKTSTEYMVVLRPSTWHRTNGMLANIFTGAIVHEGWVLEATPIYGNEIQWK
jgi:hypothetical protein